MVSTFERKVWYSGLGVLYSALLYKLFTRKKDYIKSDTYIDIKEKAIKFLEKNPNDNISCVYLDSIKKIVFIIGVEDNFKAIKLFPYIKNLVIGIPPDRVITEKNYYK